jgi:glycosyltransferase involved in cell wall biosynthesis
VIDGFLDPDVLLAYVAAADIVALPFELVPSDAPLSLLEAAALGKPLVTTNTACLPELAAYTAHFIAEPADTHSLAETLICAAHYSRQSINPEKPTFSRTWAEMGADWAAFLESM